MPVGPLDTRGWVAVSELAVYVIFLGITGLHVFRHGFRREGGWLYLLAFSLFRITGSALIIGAETSNNTVPGVYITAYVLESSGLSILLLAAISYLSVVSQVTTMGEIFVHRRALRGLRVLLIVAGIVAIIGGVDSPTSNPDLQRQGEAFRKVSGIMYTALFLLIAGLHLYYWTRASEILRYRKKLLALITFALLPLTVRVVYALFSSLAPNTTPDPSSPSKLSDLDSLADSLFKFNVVTGEVRLYIFMNLVMEIIVVCVYCVGGIVLPLGTEDYALAGKADRIDLDSI